MLINTVVLLVSSLHRWNWRDVRAARNAALAQLTAVSEVSVDADEKISWLALTVVAGLEFFGWAMDGLARTGLLTVSTCRVARAALSSIC